MTPDTTKQATAGQANQRLIIHSTKCKRLSRGLILSTNPRRPLRSQSVHKMIHRALPPPHSKPTRFSNGYSVLRSYHGELLFWHWVLREKEGECVCVCDLQTFYESQVQYNAKEEGQILLLLMSHYSFYYSNGGTSAKPHCLHPSLSRTPLWKLYCHFHHFLIATVCAP